MLASAVAATSALLSSAAADPNPGEADGTVTWNFEDHQWELGNDFQAGEFDFLSTATHELLHAVGFLSNIVDSGVDIALQDATDQAANGGIWSPYDQFVGDSSGALISQTANFVMDMPRLTASITGGTGTAPATDGLYFYGSNAMAANGGNRCRCTRQLPMNKAAVAATSMTPTSTARLLQPA